MDEGASNLGFVDHRLSGFLNDVEASWFCLIVDCIVSGFSKVYEGVTNLVFLVCLLYDSLNADKGASNFC